MKKRKFKSFIALQLDEFVLYQLSSGIWIKGPDYNLFNFDAFLYREYRNGTVLTEEMLKWCKCRVSEKLSTCYKRTHAVWDFVEFSNSKGWSDLCVERIKKWEPCTYEPHFFTKEELKTFFNECDKYFANLRRHQGKKACQLLSLEVPVYFRLLYSSGLRTCEARWLKRSDVDFDTGVVKVEKSKGGHQHRIVLHPTMLELMRKYDAAIDKIMPERIYLFPDQHGNCYSDKLSNYYFRKIWPKVSNERARAYDLRSNYAVMNISSWDLHGYEFSNKLMFLSRSMGHVNINSTYHYFHVTPMLTEKLKSLTNDGFSEMTPTPNEYCYEEES